MIGAMKLDTPSHDRRKRRALLVVNTRSRRGRDGIGDAAEVFRAAGLELVEADCVAGADIGPCILAHRETVDCVVVGGGDGTINAAARALVDTGLPLGVLPLGTANDFARSIGIPLDLAGAARVIGAGHSQRVDAGDVNGHLFFNVASVGLAADLAKAITTERKRRYGRLSYAISAAKLTMEARPFHAIILAGEGELRETATVRTMQIAVGNGRFYGGGNVVATDARIDDGFLDLYSLEFAEVWRMALMIPSFQSGAHGSVREVRTARSGTFEVITRRPRPVNADGELVTQTPAIFTQRKRAVRVYAPPR